MLVFAFPAEGQDLHDAVPGFPWGMMLSIQVFAQPMSYRSILVLPVAPGPRIHRIPSPKAGVWGPWWLP